jgi:hypothetical protein
MPVSAQWSKAILLQFSLIIDVATISTRFRIKNCDPWRLGTVRQTWARCSLCISLCQWESISDQVVPLKHASRIIGYNWHPLAWEIGRPTPNVTPNVPPGCLRGCCLLVMFCQSLTGGSAGRLQVLVSRHVKALLVARLKPSQRITTYHNVSRNCGSMWWSFCQSFTTFPCSFHVVSIHFKCFFPMEFCSTRHQSHQILRSWRVSPVRFSSCLGTKVDDVDVQGGSEMSEWWWESEANTNKT